MARAEQLRYLSLCGMLGYGYPRESLEAALEHDLAFIGVDAGSTDPGPYYLGSGKPFVSDAQVRRDLLPALEAAVTKRVPLIIGSAGGSGAAPHVERFTGLLQAIAAERGLRFKLAVIHTDVDRALIKRALAEGRIGPCGPGDELTAEVVDRVCNPVAQVGTEPIIEALSGGADVIVCGRCCDTAVFAALPIMRGFDPGLALHAGKIAECGTLCAHPEGANDSLLCTLYPDRFEVVPVNPKRRCIPRSVAAHSLYEQPDPLRFIEPEGEVDLRGSTITAVDERTVRVSGSRLIEPAERTVKLEGAELAGYRSISIAGVSDPRAIESIDLIQESVRASVASALSSEDGGKDYELRFRRYGLDAVSWASRRGDERPREIGLVIEALAATQETANTVLSLARATALHQSFPGRKTTAGNLAFPYSPSDLSCGAVYRFSLYHLMRPRGDEGFGSVKFSEVGGA